MTEFIPLLEFVIHAGANNSRSEAEEDFEGSSDEVKREVKRGVACDVKHDSS